MTRRSAPPHPPRWARTLLSWLLPGGTSSRSILGDLDQEFREKASATPGTARWWYAWEALKLAGHFALHRARMTAARGKESGRRRRMGFMEQCRHHLRFGWKGLKARPGFTALAALTMAVGIGSNVAIFSVVKAVLLDPLPYQEPDRLMAIFEWKQPREDNTNVANPGNVRAWRDGASSFSNISAVSLQMPATFVSRGRPEEAMVQYAHPDFFQTLGLDTEVGRNFRTDAPELVEGEVVLSHRYWQERFGGSPDIIGSAAEVNGDAVEIVGVLPSGYVAFGDGTALWVSMDTFRGDQTDSGRWLWAIGRLERGATPEQATDELRAIAAGLQEEFPDFNGGWTVNPVPLKDHVIGEVRGVLWVLMGAVGLLLLIASVNVANLFLIRATERQKEMAVRSSVGASGRALAGQLLAESLLVAGIGSGLGIALAHLGTRLLAARIPAAFSLPRVTAAGVDGGVLLVAAAVTVFTGLLFGMVPAFQGARTRPANILNAESRGPSQRTGKVRNVLVVAEVALSLVLLSGAALLGRSLANLLAEDPGIDPEQVLVGRVNLSGPAYEEEEAQVAFFQELGSRIQERPEVETAGGITFLPMDGLGAGTSYYPMDRPPPPSNERRAADIRNILGDYFEAMGVTLLAGRVFDTRDGPDGTRTVIVNQTMARRYWPEESAVGKQLYISWETDEPWEIVGVVEDVRLGGLAQEPRETIYLSYPRTPYFSFLHVVVRARGAPGELASVLRDEVQALDSGLPVGRIRVMDDLVAASAAAPRMTAFLMFLFSVLATLLAVVGLYGALAYTVSKRLREIGVRIALGARPRTILTMVLREGGILALAGVALGAAVAIAGGRVVAGLLYDLEPADPVSIGSAGLLLFSVALVASALPAWRAARVPPSESLRED